MRLGITVSPDGNSMLEARQNDILPATILTIVDLDNAGKVLDLTGATAVQALFYSPNGALRTRLWSRATTIQTPATLGQVSLAWQSSDLATVGLYGLDLQVQYAGPTQRTTVASLPVLVSAAAQ